MKWLSRESTISGEGLKILKKGKDPDSYSDRGY